MKALARVASYWLQETTLVRSTVLSQKMKHIYIYIYIGYVYSSLKAMLITPSFWCLDLVIRGSFSFLLFYQNKYLF